MTSFHRTMYYKTFIYIDKLPVAYEDMLIVSFVFKLNQYIF